MEDAYNFDGKVNFVNGNVAVSARISAEYHVAEAGEALYGMTLLVSFGEALDSFVQEVN